MSTIPSTDEHIGGHDVERTQSQEAIIEIKALRKANPKATYHRIMEEVAADGTGKSISLSHLRRICKDGSEAAATSFSYENMLIPVRDALRRLQTKDLPGVPDSDVVDALRAIIAVQDEEIASLHEMKEHLEARVDFLVDQIKKKDRRMDEKDKIIRQYMKKEAKNKKEE